MPRSALIEGDAFFGFLANGAIDPWLPESHEQNTVVTRAAGKATGEFVAGKFSVVYDGVIGPWFLETFLRTAGLTEADYAVIVPPLVVCQQRVKERTGHGFTDLPATASMHRQFSEAELEPQHIFRHHDRTPSETAEEIRRSSTAGRLRRSSR